jgi:hypothetical protein
MRHVINERSKADRPGVLSSLWVVVLLNMLFRDVHEFLRPGAIEEFASSTISEATLLGSGVVLSVFISMIVLSRVLPRRTNRWTNIALAILAMGPMFAFPPNDLDDAWFLVPAERSRRRMVPRSGGRGASGDHLARLDMAL